MPTKSRYLGLKGVPKKGTPLRPKYLLYGYMEPLGQGFWSLWAAPKALELLNPTNPKHQEPLKHMKLCRALGHVIFSLIGLRRILFTNIFQKL